MTTFDQTVVLNCLECGKCGGTYAISLAFQNYKQETGGGWHCPYCQAVWGYFGNSEIEKLRRELRQSKCETLSERARREAAERERARLAKRASAGVCPRCNRTFKQLANHMKCKHPDCAAEGGGR